MQQQTQKGRATHEVGQSVSPRAFHDLTEDTLNVPLAKQGFSLLPVLDTLGTERFSIEKLHVAIKSNFPHISCEECIKIAQDMVADQRLITRPDSTLYKIKRDDLIGDPSLKVTTPGDAIATLRRALASQAAFSLSSSPDDLLAKVAIAGNGRPLKTDGAINELVFKNTGMVLPVWKQRVCAAIRQDFDENVRSLTGMSPTLNPKELGNLLNESPFQFLLGAVSANRFIAILRGDKMQSKIAEEEGVKRQAVSSGIRSALGALPDWIRALIQDSFRFRNKCTPTSRVVS
ncbi:MAG: hypothetical protein RIS36_1056 [Pseudomonadota bacterium]|jgi:hypothetical protein